MTERLLGVLGGLVLDIGKPWGSKTVRTIKEMALVTFVEPRSHPLTPELNFLDLAEGGENLREMLLVDVPCQSPDVNLAWWRRRRFLPPTRPAPGSLGAGPLSHFLLLSRGLLALLPLLLPGLPTTPFLPARLRLLLESELDLLLLSELESELELELELESRLQ